MTKGENGQWDVLLADLSLILFIVALGGLVSIPGSNAAEQTELEVAPSQALYRQIAGGPSVSEWLEGQARDPRATLTIFIDYSAGDATSGLQQAAAMIEAARAQNVPVRTVLRSADQDDIYASLAFDAEL